MKEDKEHDFFGLNSSAFINCIELGVMSEDQYGKIIFANQKLLDLLEYSPDELIGKHWTEIVPADEQKKIERQMRTRIKGAKSHYETQILTKLGKKIPVIVCSRPIFQSVQKPESQSTAEQYQGTISTFTDITERKDIEHEIKSKSERLEFLNRALNLQRKKLLELTDQLGRANEELKRLSEAKSDFVSAVSHDLRTPLTTIIEGISLVEDGTLGNVNEEQQKFLKLAIEDAERLNDFIGDILDLSKIEAGKLVPKKTKINPKEVIERIRLSYQNFVKDKGLELLIELPKADVEVLCDPGHYHRTLANFLSNAIKFTPAGGKITLQVEPQKDNMVRTQVKDTGIGIPPEQKNHIFQKFEQIDRPARHPGSGLGLSLCKQLVELNNGKIGFDSEINKGSVFFFMMPIYDEFSDLNYMLDTISQQAKAISGHVIVFLFKVTQEPIKESDLANVLKKVVSGIQPKTLSYDLVRIFSRRQEVIIVSALPEESANPTFADFVETLQKSELGENGLRKTKQLAASFYVCPDVQIEAQTLLRILENHLAPIIK